MANISGNWQQGASVIGSPTISKFSSEPYDPSMSTTQAQPDGLRAIHTRILSQCDALFTNTRRMQGILDSLVGAKPLTDGLAGPAQEDHALSTVARIETIITEQAFEQNRILADIERALA